MSETFESNIHLEPEMSWEDCATFIYDGVIDGKLNREDFIKLFVMSGQEMSEPRHARIFAKVIGAFFNRYYPDIRLDEKPGVFVIVDGSSFIVSCNDKEITIDKADDIKDAADCTFLIIHDTEADAKIAAWENKERYVERI